MRHSRGGATEWQHRDSVIACASGQCLSTTNATSRLFSTFNNADGSTTVIKGLQIDADAAGEIYDLQGRKVAAPQRGGLYIINGKKVVMK